MSRPHAPLIFIGLAGRSWSRAMRTVTGSKSTRNVEQQVSRPHEPMLPLHPRVVAGRELGEHDLRVDRGGEVAHELAEVDAHRRGEEHRRGRAARLVADVGPVDAADLHRQLVLADQPLRGDLDLRAAPLVVVVATQVGVGRGPGADRQPADVVDPLGAPDDLGHLGRGARREQHLVADAPGRASPASR